MACSVVPITIPPPSGVMRSTEICSSVLSSAKKDEQVEEGEVVVPQLALLVSPVEWSLLLIGKLFESLPGICLCDCPSNRSRSQFGLDSFAAPALTLKSKVQEKGPVC